MMQHKKTRINTENMNDHMRLLDCFSDACEIFHVVSLFPMAFLGLKLWVQLCVTVGLSQVTPNGATAPSGANHKKGLVLEKVMLSIAF